LLNGERTVFLTNGVGKTAYQSSKYKTLNYKILRIYGKSSQHWIWCDLDMLTKAQATKVKIHKLD
jgi:hypothetical protein